MFQIYDNLLSKICHMYAVMHGTEVSVTVFLWYTTCHVYNLQIVINWCVSVCVWEQGGGGGTPHMHGHEESYKDLNLKILTSSNPRPHEY